MEKHFSEDPEVEKIERGVIELFDSEFKIDLFYRENTQLLFKYPPSSLIAMYFQIMSKALEDGKVPESLNITINKEEEKKEEQKEN